MTIPLDTVILLLGLLLLLAALLYAQRKGDNFDLRWVLVDTTTEKVSLMKLGQFVALCVSTWVLIHEVRAGRLTEWLFFGYIATFSGANLANKFIDRYKEPAK